MIAGLVQNAFILIAQQPVVPWQTRRIWLLLAAIIVLAILLGIVALWLRKQLLTPPDQPLTGFTLQDLREMHAQGQLSDEELAAAEEKALARSRSHYLGHAVAPLEEPEDIGHLSTGSEDDFDDGTENVEGSSDKKLGDEPGL